MLALLSQRMGKETIVTPPYLDENPTCPSHKSGLVACVEFGIVAFA